MRPNMQKRIQNFQKSVLLPYICEEKNRMHGYEIHEALYQTCEINGPWVRGSSPRVGPIWPYVKYWKGEHEKWVKVVNLNGFFFRLNALRGDFLPDPRDWGWEVVLNKTWTLAIFFSLPIKRYKLKTYLKNLQIWGNYFSLQSCTFSI